jgi:hypothetical protein
LSGSLLGTIVQQALFMARYPPLAGGVAVDTCLCTYTPAEMLAAFWRLLRSLTT